MSRKIAHVLWLDAAYLGAKWRTASSVKEDDGCLMESAGFVVKENECGLWLAADADPEDATQYRHVSFIPKGMIRKKTVINFGGKKR